MRFILVLLTMAVASSAFGADDVCYQLSKFKDSFSKTPELLCKTQEGENTIFVLKSGMPMNQQEIGRLNLQHLGSAKCMWCNISWYGVKSPSNSVFKEFSVNFDGKIDPQTGAESGTVSIGQVEFFYERQ